MINLFLDLMNSSKTSTNFGVFVVQAGLQQGLDGEHDGRGHRAPPRLRRLRPGRRCGRRRKTVRRPSTGITHLNHQCNGGDSILNTEGSKGQMFGIYAQIFGSGRIWDFFIQG